ncbi:ferredoxin [Streptomyces sp. HMX112]|uniref:ferredoxin n=1 Tax=Streptomyces sp. HMX112 TaxID=3390850 RepID=UPI003A7FC7DF
MELSVTRERCVGAGMCALTAPGLFDQDEDEGLVVLLDARPPRDHHTSARVAAGACPAGVISVIEHAP